MEACGSSNQDSDAALNTASRHSAQSIAINNIATVGDMAMSSRLRYSPELIELEVSKMAL
jgi:O-acetylhomoserine/O-acetylserine sulfhydrylase-like pyridoxal-dependent enzyme